RYLRPHRKHFILAVIFGATFALLSGVSLTMVVPFTKIIFEMNDVSLQMQQQPIEYSKLLHLDKDTIVRIIGGTTKPEILGRFCIFLILIFLIKNIFLYGWSYFIVSVEQGVVRDIRDELFAHYHKLPLEFFHGHSAGELISRITNDITLVRGAVANGLSDLIKNFLQSIVFVALVFMASWKMAIATILIMPPSVALISVFGKAMRSNSTKTQREMAAITTTLQESVSGIRVVKAFAMERFEISRFKKFANDYFQTMVRLTRIGSLAIPLTEMLGVIAATIILWYAGSQILAGTGLTSDKFFLFLISAFALMQPVKVLSRVNIDIQQGLAAGARIFQVLDTRPKIEEKPNPVILTRFNDEIRFDHVGFHYPDGSFVLENINFEVKKGQIVALVGPSGGGKSTIADLIPRFYDPTSGCVIIDEHDLKDVGISSLRNLLGIVTQETILFNDTVYNNVAYGQAEIGREAVERALEAACALDFVREMPQGLDTIIGDRGVKLSGGQRQRLAIARALLKDPPILIFDEATSALDSESEQLITQAISNLLSGRTVVIIAHRLSTIRRADLILVVDNGKIVETGDHTDLITKSGLYKRLYDLQFQDTVI
ncbi:MAG TPA: ABC transporter ATP-binding protein, partial [candidate division Zixibacteria bacterium]|nr:ABC transporter ATP-binding protein [candidate division Zixibacteria bacterium]